MKLVNVWVVEGGSGNGGASFAAFDLRVEPTGWTLTDAEEPSVERQWSWQAMGGLVVVRGAGKTPDGRPATALDVIVNGWPVRVLVSSQDLTYETIEMLGAFAPVGHPLRASPRVRRESSLRRLSDASRQFAATRLRARPVSLLSAGATRLRSALVIGVVLVVAVVVASIAGVATSAQTTTTTAEAGSGHGTTAPHGTSSVPDPTVDTASGQVPGSSSAPTSVAPAVAASSSRSTAGFKASLTSGTTIRRPGAGVSSTTATTKPTTTTTGGTATTQPGTTTSAVKATTTTTRAPRPTTTTTAPPPTTTAPPTTVPPTTEPPTTVPPTTQPPPVTTTSLLKLVVPFL